MFDIAFVIFESGSLPREDAIRYWRTSHRRLVSEIPGVQAYSQSDAFLGDGDPPFLGVATLSFDSEAAFQKAAAGQEFATAVADVANFANPVSVAAFSLIPMSIARGEGS